MITREDKELLLKDLCGRLPYGVIVDYKENEFEIPHWKITTIHPDTFDGWIGYDKRVGAGSESGSRPFKIGEVKPYLRSMSSMTKEEFENLKEYSGLKYDQLDLASFQNGAYKILDFYLNEVPSGAVIRVFDWLNKYHFDYRDLIQMGLAIEAPKDMYLTK